MPTDDQFLKSLGDADQIAAAVVNLAQMLRAYKDELKKQGFSDKECWTLLIEYQRNLFQNRQ